MKMFKYCAVAVLAATSFVATAPSADAQNSISEIYEQIRRDASKVAAENAERERKFRAERDQRASLLAEARAELRQLEQREATIRGQFSRNDGTIQRLTAERDAATGEFSEVFGLSRTKASEFRATLDNSMVSAELQGRTAELEKIANSKALPTTEQLNLMYTTMLDEIRAQREVKSFETSVANHNDGAPIQVTRVGPFAAFTKDGGEFLSYTSSAASRGQLPLSKPKRQRGGEPNEAAARVGAASGGDIVYAPIDPTRGSLVKTFDRYPTWVERYGKFWTLKQGHGGGIGVLIQWLAFIGILFGLFNLVRLLLIGSSVRGQKRKAQAGKNPLGRIMSAYDGVKDKGGEAVELALDEAILKESPKLEWGLSLLKLGAGIAPLMGLLGTVTGMIKTFQAMTIFGTGNAQTMAGGISEALITTMLGLVAAIPLLILHSLNSSVARGVQATLEEQSAGIVARHIENRGA